MTQVFKLDPIEKRLLAILAIIEDAQKGNRLTEQLICLALGCKQEELKKAQMRLQEFGYAEFNK